MTLWYYIKPTNNFSDNIKTSKKAWKESKDRFQKEKYKQKHSSSNTSTTRNNTSSNNREPKGIKKDFSGITFYNCN